MVIKKVILKEGHKFGDMTFVSEAGYYIHNGNNIRMINIRCHCGNIFKTRYGGVVSGTTKSCGCVRIKKLKEQVTKHGMYNSKHYGRWGNIISRCYDENNSRYKDYGGRGIIVHDEWRKDFKAFNDYIVKLPNNGECEMTLDRIDNDGNYEPGNIKWSTAHEQIANQKLRRNNKSGHKGIRKRGNVYNARITINGKEINIGHFKTLEDAVKARLSFIKENNLIEYNS